MQKLRTSIFANEPSDRQRAAKAVVLEMELSEEREVPLGVEGWCLPTPCKKGSRHGLCCEEHCIDTNPFANRSIVYQFFCQDIVRVISYVGFESKKGRDWSAVMWDLRACAERLVTTLIEVEVPFEELNRQKGTSLIR